MSSENWEGENKPGTSVPSSVDELGSRISQVLELYPDRKSASEKAGKSVDQLLAYVKGTSAPPWTVLVRLALGVNVSLDWLATGRGGMQQTVPVARILPASNEREGGVPIYDAVLSLGSGATNGDSHPVGVLDLPDEYLRDVLHCRPGNAVAAYMRGDSMVPTLLDRDLAIIDTGIDTVERDDIYAFSLDGEGYIKRLQRAGAELIVHSDNPAYSDWKITGAQLRGLHVIGRIAGTIRRT